jgi:hypothetical protein
MSAETNVGEDFGLIHAPLANIGNEIVHERTQDHSVRKERQTRHIDGRAWKYSRYRKYQRSYQI